MCPSHLVTLPLLVLKEQEGQWHVQEMQGQELQGQEVKVQEVKVQEVKVEEMKGQGQRHMKDCDVSLCEFLSNLDENI